MIAKNSFSDFVLFLYVHMAMIDGAMHEAEEDVILRKMESRFPSVENKKQLLNQVVENYKALDHEMIHKIIKDSFNHFDQAKQDKEEIYADMFDIINADGQVAGAETKALSTLNEIIHLISEK